MPRPDRGSAILDHRIAPQVAQETLRLAVHALFLKLLRVPLPGGILPFPW